MRKLFLLFAGILTISFFNSCADEEVEPAGHFTYDGNEYTVEYGVIDDKGTNDEITYRKYAIELKSGNIDDPKSYLKFVIYSNSTTRLEEGVYTYAYIAGASEFSYLKFGCDIEYDESGVAISGTRISESSATISGTITVSQEDGDYKFIFDMDVTYNSNTSKLTGEFHDILHDEYVSYY